MNRRIALQWIASFAASVALPSLACGRAPEEILQDVSAYFSDLTLPDGFEFLPPRPVHLTDEGEYLFGIAPNCTQIGWKGTVNGHQYGAYVTINEPYPSQETLDEAKDSLRWQAASVRKEVVYPGRIDQLMKELKVKT